MGWYKTDPFILIKVGKQMKSLEITKEEKDALKIYCEWEHTYINLLTNGDMEAIHKLNNDRLDIFSAEYFANRMETLKKIYSAMVKYEKNIKMQIGYGSRNVIRGTTLSEIEYIRRHEGKCNKILSTTADELTAKQYAGSKVFGVGEKNDKTNVILKLYIGSNVPYISVNGVLEEESNHPRENEFAIAPFTRLDGIKHISSWDRYEYYSGSLESQELEKVDNQEELLNDINANINNIPKLVSEYMEKKYQQDNLLSVRISDLDFEDIEDMKHQSDEVANSMKSLENKFYSIRNKMIQYAMGICYDARQKVDREYEAELPEYNKAKSLEESKRFERECVNGYMDVIRGILQKMAETTDRYDMYAKTLGLTWNTGVSQELLMQTYGNLKGDAISQIEDGKFSFENFSHRC